MQQLVPPKRTNIIFTLNNWTLLLHVYCVLIDKAQFWHQNRLRVILYSSNTFSERLWEGSRSLSSKGETKLVLNLQEPRNNYLICQQKYYENHRQLVLIAELNRICSQWCQNLCGWAKSLKCKWSSKLADGFSLTLIFVW